MELIGKTAPLEKDLREAHDSGFDKIELYMKEEFLSERNLKFLSVAKRTYGMEFYSIHTPHSRPEVFLDVLRRTKDFADSADIPVVVVHSQFVDVFSYEVLDAVGRGMFVENGYDHDLSFLNGKMGSGVKICFDTAHFYVGDVSFGGDYYSDMETLFKTHGKNVGHLHFSDVTEEFLGMKPPISNLEDFDVNVGEGVIDFQKIVPVLSKYYKGVAVVEVDVEKQKENMALLQSILDG